MIDLFLYFLLSFATFFIYFLPGFLISRFFKKFSGVEQLVLGFLLSTLIFFVIGLMAHLLGLGWNSFTLLIPSIVLILILFMIKRDFKISKEAKFLLIIFFIQFFVKLLILPNIEFFPQGGDWKTNYEISKTFINKEWVLSGDRTFLYNYILGFFMSIFQQDYWYAQVVNALLSSIFLLPLYLIGLKFFSKKIAILSFFLLLISPFIHWTLYTWSKLFAGFFILIVYYFIMRRNLNFFVGLSAALAFLIHPFSLLYIIPAGALILYKREEFKLDNKVVSLVLLPLIITVALWYGYSSIVPSTRPSIFKYYPIAVGGYESLYEKSGQEILDDFINTPPHKIALTRIANAAIPTVPLTFPALKIIGIFSPITVPLYKSVDLQQIPWSYHHLLTFPGHISVLLFAFAALGFFKLFKDKSKKKDLLWLTIGPFLLSLFLFGWIVPLGSNIGLPLSPLLVLIGFWEIEKTKEEKKWIWLIFMLVVLESVVFSYWLGLHIEFTKQVIVQSGSMVEYNKIITAYKLFR